MPPALSTPRLYLRELTERDAHAVYLLNRSPSVTRYLAEPNLTSDEHALEILRTRILPQYGLYGVGRLAVLRQDTGELVGWCGLKYLPEKNEYDLGYRFHEHCWGQGYATEAARAVLDWARVHLAGKRIVGAAEVDNHASIRVLQKIGLRMEGYDKGDDRTTVIYVVAPELSRNESEA